MVLKRFFLFVFCCFWLPQTALAQEFETPAPTAIILDGETGLVLFEKNAREPIPPASMTKIMTLYMVFERLASNSLSLDDEFTVSDEAWRRGGFRSGSSTMCLKPKERVRVEDLIRGVIVLSGNDAAITLAENISGSEEAFARAMTARAHELGLNSVNFLNATGWPAEGHEISAYDLAELSRMTIEKFPEYYKYYQEREYDWCKASPSNRFNRNPLLAVFDGADGLKTGHTKAAGYGLVGSAVRKDQRRIIVLSGMSSKRERVQQAERVMRAAFGEFEVKTLYQPQEVVGDVKVYLGKAKTVSVQVENIVLLGVFKPQQDKVRAHIVYEGPVAAPIAVGQKLAVLVVSSPGQPDMEIDLIASQSVARVGFFSRVGAGLVQMIQGKGSE
jgi:D-alanyl-D-alanine carboxypeptidase (penicillin-binding protein 5/6)